MGYFSKQVGRPVVATNGSTPPQQLSPEGHVAKPSFAVQVGKQVPGQSAAALDHCPRCNGVMGEEDGFAHCSGRCGRRWLVAGPGRWIDPATLPFGACSCCRPRLALVAAEVGAICPGSHAEYLILPEGVRPRTEVAQLGVCRCCLPPQPLVKMASGLVCRNKPQQHYQVVNGPGINRQIKEEVVWVGLAPALDQATVTAAIDAALRANHAELTLFGLFAPPPGG